jgi:dUTP pyrophosphatase
MEKSKLEGFLARLEELDRQLSDESEHMEFMTELNDILNGLTKEVQLDVTKKTISAKLKFINKSNNPDPSFEKEGDNGFDIRASLKTNVLIRQGQSGVIPTGLYFEVDKGMEIQLRSKRGIAIGYKVFVLNSPDAIDTNNREEVHIILANFGNYDFSVENGDIIAQGVVCPVYGEGNLMLEKSSD